MNIKETIQLLGIQDITTKRQKANGTVTWKLPIKRWGKFIEVASFKSGYVRNNNSGYSNYQLNNKKKIAKESDRLKYLISYCLKNYYIKQANMIENGKFVPKWKYDDLADAARIDYERERLNVSVNVNGQRYEII